jgi:hypothetical protein
MVSCATRTDGTPTLELNLRAMKRKLDGTMSAIIWERKLLPPLPNLASSLSGFALHGELMQCGCQRHLADQRTETLQFCSPRELCAALGA